MKLTRKKIKGEQAKTVPLFFDLREMLPPHRSQLTYGTVYSTVSLGKLSPASFNADVVAFSGAGGTGWK